MEIIATIIITFILTVLLIYFLNKKTNLELNQKINELNLYHSQNFNQIAGNYQQNIINLKNDINLSLKNIQTDNEKKLDKIQNIVSEKLEENLEKRVSSSFKMVNERLEQVYKGLGEMQNLAASVGDLKKVLTNVKTRGVWGEIQLEKTLTQILDESQFVKNFAPKENSQERVEFAIKIPQRKHNQKFVYLPIDAKFPLSEYEKLIDARDENNLEEIKKSKKRLESQILNEAKNIAKKYINPPITTEFAILYLPNESLYLELIKNTSLIEKIQSDHQIMLVGPNNIIALLNTIELSFKAFAIEERSKEMWQLLNYVMKEFSQFKSILGKTHKKISESLITLEKANTKSNQISSKLNSAYLISEKTEK
jgi:DNA recombination protein RmuC